MLLMFSEVHLKGGMLFLMAAFSAGRPKESQPIGWNTLKPFIFKKRDTRSPMV